jgi:hypothetical protein
VVILGIHTPETEAEKSIDALQKKLKAAGLDHPVAADNNGTMWRRYNNSYWPSIYLVDKKGVARWGWVGELTWNGARGDVQMRRKIEDLLGE